jgi:hypothetical protein
MLARVVNQIPEETAVKVHCGFLDIYHKKERNGGPVDFRETFSNFYRAREILRDEFEVGIEDNEWFEKESATQETKSFAGVVKKRYADMSRSSKGDNASRHDSLCIRWIDERRSESGNNNVWFLTRDHTLPGCVPEGCDKKSLSIHLDAVLQWLAPVAVGEKDEIDLELAYSKMLVSRILPHEQIYTLEDFLIFDELNMTCRELPAEDVEGCIQTIKIRAPFLNPLVAADREELAHEVSVYFADPSRKYKRNIVALEGKVNELSKDLAETRGDLAEEKKRSAKGVALVRVAIVGVVFVVGELVTIIGALFLGEGENAFQRITGSWGVITGVGAACVIFGAFFVGKERIRALGWPFTKIFGDGSRMT